MSEPDQPAAGHWAQLRESGTYFGIQFCYWVYRWFGRGLFRVILVPAMAYFYLVRPVARKASLEYLDQMAVWRPEVFSKPPGWWLTYRHLLAFGETILDKIIAWSGGVDKDQIDVVNDEVYRAIRADSRGRLLMGSHFGNLEYCRAFASKWRDVTVNVLMHDRHAANFNRVLKRADPDSRLNLFAVEELDVSTILRLKEKVANGEYLVIAADRVPVDSEGRTVLANFLGRPAPFPIGPYVLAATLECPVSLIFGWRSRSGIVVRFEHFSDRVVIARQNRQQSLEQLTQQFADRLSEYCTRAPLQWFNFYPFWGKGVSDDPSS